MFVHRLASPLLVVVLLAATLALSAPVEALPAPAAPEAGPVTPTGPVPADPADLAAHLAAEAPLGISGPQKIVVLRVLFSDYSATRYTQAQVQGFFDTEIDKMWQNISYGNITIAATVSALLNLPHPRSNYITDFPDGDLSIGGQYMAVLNDAIAAANAAGVSFAGAKDVMVVMGETAYAQYHRGQAGTCMLPVGPGGSLISIGCAIFSENPADPDARVWGRWMHEMGHAFQAADGPAHPSNYNNSFELMDRLYPGHSGMFSKQAVGAGGFPGWIDPSAYVEVPTSSGGTSASLYAEEYQPSEIAPGGKRAIKFWASASVYYMISVRGRLNGDEVRPIPDTQGVLIERVVPGADPWVTVIGPGGDPDHLWQPDQNYTNATDGVLIGVGPLLDPSKVAYQVRAERLQSTPRADVMIRPWLAPPLNTWETTDIWIDSSCNGYGTFMYGTYTPPGDATALGAGNGDSPCANHENRIYARIRNTGTTPAANVVVHLQVTDPLGVGINGSTWTEVATVTKLDAGGAGLASLANGTYTDVWAPWTPSVALTPEQLAAGTFNYHSCVRVLIDPVAGEQILTNQDGIDEQENIGEFFAQAAGPGSPAQIIDYMVPLRNDDLKNSRTFNLVWKTDMPAGWKVSVNKDEPTLRIPAGDLALVPVQITRGGPADPGEVYSMTLQAEFLQKYDSGRIDTGNRLELPDVHWNWEGVGGATLSVLVADPTDLKVRPRRQPNGDVCVRGNLSPAPGANDVVQVWIDLLGAKHEILGGKLARVDMAGQFSLCFTPNMVERLAEARFASAVYQGAGNLIKPIIRPGAAGSQLASGYRSSAYAEQFIANSEVYLPLVSR